MNKLYFYKLALSFLVVLISVQSINVTKAAEEVADRSDSLEWSLVDDGLMSYLMYMLFDSEDLDFITNEQSGIISVELSGDIDLPKLRIASETSLNALNTYNILFWNKQCSDENLNKPSNISEFLTILEEYEVTRTGITRNYYFGSFREIVGAENSVLIKKWLDQNFRAMFESLPLAFSDQIEGLGITDINTYLKDNCDDIKASTTLF